MRNTQTINSSEMGNQLGKLIEDALQGQTTIIQRYGRSVAVIVPISVLEEYLTLKAALEAETLDEGRAVTS